jgi:hypothetical protein
MTFVRCQLNIVFDVRCIGINCLEYKVNIVVALSILPYWFYFHNTVSVIMIFVLDVVQDPLHIHFLLFFKSFKMLQRSSLDYMLLHVCCFNLQIVFYTFGLVIVKREFLKLLRFI